MKLKKNKILVLGSTGMLGHQVVKYFLNYPEYEIFDISFRFPLRDKSIILDVMDQNSLNKVFKEIQPKYVVNCIGDLVRKKPDFERAIFLNSYLPHLLKSLCKNSKAKLIHISTDCVFSGKKGRYSEFDYRDGTGLYAETKKLGEVIDNKNLTLRTSFIGPELKQSGVGLFQWFVKENGPINGFTKTIWSGVTTIELSKAIKSAIESEITGLYHITNGESINKNDLLNLFDKYLKRNAEIIPVEGEMHDKSFIDTRQLIAFRPPSYETMVREMVEDAKLNNDIYKYNLI